MKTSRSSYRAFAGSMLALIATSLTFYQPGAAQMNKQEEQALTMKVDLANKMVENGEYVGAGRLFASLSRLESEGPRALRVLYYRRLGSYYACISNHKLMIESLRKAVALNPKDKDVELAYYNYLGEEAKQCAPPLKVERTMDYLYARLRTEPRNPSVWTSLIEWQSRDPRTLEGAEQSARQLLKLNLTRASQASAYNYLGMLLVAKGRSAEGISAFKEAVRLAPTDPGILVNMACALNRSHKDEATRAFKRASALAKDNPRTIYSILLVCHSLGLHDLELQTFNQEKGPRCARSSYLPLQRAHCLLSQQKPAEAKRVFYEGCARLPLDAELLYQKASFEGDLGNFRAAAYLAGKAVDAVPNDCRYLHTYVNLCQNAQRFDQALVALSKLKALQPENSMVHYQRGRILVAKNSLAEAAQEAENGKHLGLNPAEYDHVYTEIALTVNKELSVPRLQKLSSTLSLVQQRFPDSTAVRGIVNLVEKRMTVIEGRLSEKSVKSPLDAIEKSVALDAAGMACLQRGDLDKARSLFKQSLSINPKMKDGHRRLHSAYAKKGDIDKAIEVATELLSYGPDQSTYKERSVYYLLNFQEELALKDIMKLKNSNFNLAMAYSRAVPLADDNKWQMIKAMVNAHARQYTYYAGECEKKIELAKGSAEKAKLHAQIADTYWSARNFRRALFHADKAIEYGANDFRIHAIRAAALKELGQDEAARSERKLTVDLYYDGRHTGSSSL